MKREILHSEIDGSINLIIPKADGYLETRAVYRDTDTLIIYLSSLTGCNLSCRMCWLTQTNQTSDTNASPEDYIYCAVEMFNIIKEKTGFEGIKKLHFNFMGRGDVLSNTYFTEQSAGIFSILTKFSRQYIPGIKPKFKLSTIFPNDIQFDHDYEFDAYDIKKWIVDRILDGREDKPHGHDVEFYYSLYSLKPDFRKRWIPKAIHPEMVGEAFSGRDSGLRIHHALIAGQNDTEEDVALIHDWLERHDLTAKLNIVRFNPHSNERHKESDDTSIQTYLTQMKLSHRIRDVQIVSRVDEKTFASCGMFIS